MTTDELFGVIEAALRSVQTDLDTREGRLVYLAFLCARLGLGVDAFNERRIQELRQELGL